VRTAVDAAGVSLRAQLSAIARTKLAHFDERRDFFRIFYSELGSQACQASGHPRLRPLYLKQVKFLETLVASAVARGEIPACPVERVAVAITDLMRGVVRRRLLEPGDTTLEDEAAFVVDLIWRGVAGRAAAGGRPRPRPAPSARKRKGKERS
jgi:hypothetical protein